MPQLYPPVLDSKMSSIPYIPGATAANTFDIMFYMPVQNGMAPPDNTPIPNINVNPAINSTLGHIQLIIKRKADNAPAVNEAMSPDSSVIYFNPATYLTHISNGLYRLTLPYTVFQGTRPQVAANYYIQLRFGNDFIWTGNTTGIPNNTTFGNFAAWRNTQTTQSPSRFGEWSNKSSVYAAGFSQVNLTANLNDFVPEIIFTYSSTYNDPIAQVKMLWYYNTLNGTEIKSEVFNGNLASDNSFEVRHKLSVAPTQVIQVSVEAVTINNTILGQIIDIAPIPAFPSLNNIVEDIVFEGEEINDGVIGKHLELIAPAPGQYYQWNIYRMSLTNFECVKLAEGIRIVFGTAYDFKDYSVEMGEDYQYCIVGYNAAGVRQGFFAPVFPVGFTNAGYGRLTRMEPTFLTDKYHQLRLEGNVQIQNFNPNTQDSLQTTLGAKYPFYSRNAKVNYRTISIQGLISINFDRTSTFLYHDQPHIKGELNSYLDIAAVQRPERGDIYLAQNPWTNIVTTVTYPAGWYMWDGLMWVYHAVDGNIRGNVATFNALLVIAAPANGDIYFVNNGSYDPTGIWHPGGWYRFEITTANPTGIWLEYDLATPALNAYNDTGLWWVEDENNKSFHIFDRDLYDINQLSLSRQRMKDDLGGGAENLVNLDSRDPHDRKGPMSIYSGRLAENKQIDYGSEQKDNTIYLERKFREFVMAWLSNGKPKLFRSETEGNMIVVATNISFSPFNMSQRMVYTVSMTLTEIAAFKLDELLDYDLTPMKIDSYYLPGAEFKFYPGDLDPNIDSAIIYMYKSAFDIPGGADGTPINPIDTYPAVLNGVPPYTFSAAGLPAGISMNPFTGIMTGNLSGGINGPGTATLSVTDSFGRTDDMQININQVFGGLAFADSPDFNILPGQTNQLIRFQAAGNPNTINVSGNVSGGSAPYTFWAEGLPIGVVINRDTGVISGMPIYSLTGGIATITVQDRIGQSASIEIAIGQIIDDLDIEQQASFNIPRLPFAIHAGDPANYPANSFEPTGTYVMRNPSQYVSGGVPFAYPNARYAMDFYGPNFTPYFNIVTLPAVLGEQNYTFTPNQTTASSNIFTVEATDQMTNTATLTNAAYDRVIESLSIAPQAGTEPISPIAYWQAGTPLNIPITWVMAPKDLSLFVQGGIAPYTYRIPGLSPNFALNTVTGQLTSNIRASQLAHDVVLEVTDARGVTVSRTIHFMTVGDGLLSTYIDGWCANTTRWTNVNQPQGLYGRKMMHNDNGTWVPGMDLPPVYIGINGGAAFNAYRLGANTVNWMGENCNFANLVTGGTLPYTWTAVGLPPGWNINADGTIWGQFNNVAYENPNGGTAIIYATDSTPGMPVQATFVINWAPIVRRLEWGDNPRYDIPTVPAGTEMVSNVRGSNNIVSLEDSVRYGYKGYSSFYEYHVIGGTVAPYQLGETNGRISGGHDTTGASPAINATLQVMDDFGITANIAIGGGGTSNAVAWGATGPAIPPLTVGRSTLPANLIFPITAGGIVNPAYSVNPLGTVPPASNFVYDAQGHFEMNGATNPTTPSTGFNLIPYIYVLDPASGVTSRAPASATWRYPDVYPQLKRPDGTVPPGTNPVYNIPPLTVGTSYQSDLLIENSNFPGTVFTASALPPGLSLSYYTVPNNLSSTIMARIAGIPTAPVNNFACTVTATRPAQTMVIGGNTYVVTPQEVYTVNVVFQTIIGPFTYVANPFDLNVPRLNRGQAMTPVNISLGAGGGSGNYNFTVIPVADPAYTTLPPGVILQNGNPGANQASIVGTPTALANPGLLRIQCQDTVSNQTLYIDIPFAGVFDPLIFTDSPAFDIANQMINTDIPQFSVAGNVSGGVGPYTFTGVFNLANSLEPYNININGMVQGNSGQISRPARINGGVITVTDSVGSTASIQINIGQVIGALFLDADPSYDIPDMLIGTAYNRNLTLVTSGGTGPYTYAIVGGALPPGITLNPTTGVISGTATTAWSQESYCEIRVTDSVGATYTDSILVGEIYNPLTFTDSPDLDVPGSPINGRNGMLEFLPAVSGGLGPYRFLTTTIGSYVLDATTGRIILNAPATVQPPLYNIPVTVQDRVGTTATIYINVGEVYTPIVVTLSNTMNNMELIQGISNINPQRIVVQGSGGPAGVTYTYSLLQSDGTYGQQVIPGVMLDPNTGGIYGTPTDLNTNWTNIGLNFRVTDSQGHWTNADPASDWRIPKVVIDVQRFDGGTNIIPAFSINWLYTGRAFTSQDFLIGGLTISTEAQLNGPALGTAGTVLAGLAIIPATGVITGAPTYATSPNAQDPSAAVNTVIRIRRTSPAAMYTPARTVDADIIFTGSVAPMVYTGNLPALASTNAPAATVANGIMIAGYTYTYNWYPMFTGGVKPYSFVQASASAGAIPAWINMKAQQPNAGTITLSPPLSSAARGQYLPGSLDAGGIQLNILAKDGYTEQLNVYNFNYPRTYYRLVTVNPGGNYNVYNGMGNTINLNITPNNSTAGGSAVPTMYYPNGTAAGGAVNFVFTINQYYLDRYPGAYGNTPATVTLQGQVTIVNPTPPPANLAYNNMYFVDGIGQTVTTTPTITITYYIAP